MDVPLAMTMVEQLAQNRVFIGATGLLVNLGGRFIMTSYLTPMQQSIFMQPLVKRLVIFCMVFLTTRDIIVAAGITLCVVFMIEGVLSENSRFCIIPNAQRATPLTLAVGGAIPT